MAKILIVDDALFMRHRAGQALKEKGYTIVEAENGAVAVEKYQAEQPDAVLLDITMPEKDGIQTLKEILEFDKAARVVMLTAVSQQAMVMAAIKAGAKDYILKPFDPDKVLAVVEKILK
jgi:two-component system, chemotaxis family, chemotaxis protein CheY